MKRTAMPSASRATSSAISSRSSHTARRRSRCTGRPFNWPEICRLRSPSTWSIAAATAASRRATSPSGALRRKPLWKFFGDETGRELALAPARMVHQRRQERNVVPDAVDIEGIERGRLRLDRGRPRRRMRDEFGDHRIVMDRDLAAFLHAGVVAHGDAVAAHFRRRAVFHQPPDRRQEIAERIFGIDAGFHRPAGQRDVLLRQRKLFAGGDADHLLDEVDAGDEFGHGMLDLQPRVHLQEDKSSCPGLRRIRPCRRNRSSRLSPAPPPARPSCGGWSRRAAATAPPR